MASGPSTIFEMGSIIACSETRAHRCIAPSPQTSAIPECQVLPIRFTSLRKRVLVIASEPNPLVAEGSCSSGM